MSRRTFFLLLLLYLALIALPYLIAATVVPSNSIFGGFLLNPIDGNSYLAKMLQGVHGNWAFRLPYTANASSGAALFLFYIFLGHLSKALGAAPIAVFHAARLLGAVLLALSLRDLVKAILPGETRWQTFGFALVLFGSGLGWTLLPFSQMTADFWVAEAYPFLSGYANPHFPIGLALIVWILLLGRGSFRAQKWLAVMVLGCAAGIILPFSPVVAGVVLTGSALWRWMRTRELVWWPLTAMAGAAGVVLYQFWVIRSDPLLAQWDAQNLTPAPALWDLLISTLPAILLALVTAFFIRKSEENAARTQMVVWLVAGLALIYLPFNLQRRFMTGYYIPIALLACFALRDLTLRWPWGKVFVPVVIGVSLVTNLVVLLSGISGALGGAKAIIIGADEYAAYQWLAHQPEKSAVVLAGETSGLRIPAYAGQQVVYGHPFETVNAEAMRNAVTQFFSTRLTESEERKFLAVYGVEFIFYGPEEKALGRPAILDALETAYRVGEVTILRVSEGQ